MIFLSFPLLSGVNSRKASDCSECWRESPPTKNTDVTRRWQQQTRICPSVSFCCSHTGFFVARLVSCCAWASPPSVTLHFAELAKWRAHMAAVKCVPTEPESLQGEQTQEEINCQSARGRWAKRPACAAARRKARQRLVGFFSPQAATAPPPPPPQRLLHRNK